VSQKPCPGPNWHIAYFDFSSFNFNVQCHILSSAGDDGLTTDLIHVLENMGIYRHVWSGF
jgi:hypothetical protein